MMKKSDLHRGGGPRLSRQALLRGSAAGLAAASMAPLLGMFAAGSGRSAELQQSPGPTGLANEPLVAADAAIVADASIVCGLRGARHEVNLLIVTSNGELFYNHRVADAKLGLFGPWNSYTDVTAEAGHRGEIAGAHIVWNIDGLQLIAATRDGGVWHTSLDEKNGRWKPFGDVKRETGNNSVKAVDVTGVEVSNLNVHYGVVTSDGGLFHTIRSSNGSWTGLFDVKFPAGNPGDIVDADFAAPGFELHVVALTRDNGIWHTIRFGNGDWQGFSDVKYQVGKPGGAVVDVTCAGYPFELDVGTVTALQGNLVPGDLLQTKRFFTGSWQRGWNDVDILAGDPGEIVAADFAYDDEKYLHATIVTKDGTVWYSFRRPPANGGSWLAFRHVIPGQQ